MNKKARAILTMETVKWTFYTVFIAFISVIILIGLTFFINRGISDEEVEFELAKNYYISLVSDDNKINIKLLENFGDNPEPMFAARLKIGDGEYISNPNLYSDKKLCKFKTLVKCSRTYEGSYLVDGSLKKVQMDLVMREDV
jgi:hypothetical protein